MTKRAERIEGAIFQPLTTAETRKIVGGDWTTVGGTTTSTYVPCDPEFPNPNCGSDTSNLEGGVTWDF